MSPKMSARSGLAGKRPSRPQLGPSQTIFPMHRSNPENSHFFCLFSLVGQWALFTRFGVMCWCHLVLAAVCALLWGVVVPYLATQGQCPRRLLSRTRINYMFYKSTIKVYCSLLFFVMVCWSMKNGLGWHGMGPELSLIHI